MKRIKQIIVEYEDGELKGYSRSAFLDMIDILSIEINIKDGNNTKKKGGKGAYRRSK